MTVQLTNDDEKAVWLQCLQAAATLASSEAAFAMNAALVAVSTDKLFEEYKKRAER